MAATPIGDIPGARFHEAVLASFASLSSAAAVGVLPPYFGPFAHNIRIRNVWFTPTAANNSATQSASYRLLSLYNGGTAGTATATGARVANYSASATLASLAPVAFNIVDATGTTQTIASGSILYFSQTTIGAADSNGTVLVAGNLTLAYEVV